MYRKFICMLILVNSVIFAQVPFNKGVNLSNWFQSESAGQIQFTKFTKEDFANIKSLGSDVIRLPVNLHGMTTGTSEHFLDPLFLFFLDQAIDWAEELNINLILDNHSFDPAVNTDPNVEQILIPVWQQLSERYKNRSKLIFYEVLNEPHGISDLVWNTIQQNVINEIRKIDSVHTIIVGPAGWNSFHNLEFMPEYSDTNLIYTFHFYDPFIFTHQGASWTNPSMTELGNVPFPYNATSMPTLPTSLKGSWIENSFNNYQIDGTVQKVKELIDIAVDFKTQRNVNLFCGEFGVYKPKSKNEDRVLWYEEIRKYFEEKEIAWTSWDYQGGFGLFEEESNELFDYDLNIPLIEAIGFNAPIQLNYMLHPDSTGFEIYSEYISENIQESSFSNNATLNFYSRDAQNGDYCISWSNASRYGNITFNFKPDKDLSLLVNENYHLSMWLKGDAPEAEIELRFVDTKTDIPEDHPWRKGIRINNSIVSLDNHWHKLNIPLQNMIEFGSWDDAWYGPIGEFDWGNIDKLEIVAEQHDLTNINFWFDKIEIIHPSLVDVEKENDIVKNFELSQNYPNPFNPTTIIKYTISMVEPLHAKALREQLAQLKVYDVLGKEVVTLVNKKQKPGNYKVTFDASKLSGGVYFYTLRTEKNILTKKMILLK